MAVRTVQVCGVTRRERMLEVREDCGALLGLLGRERPSEKKLATRGAGITRHPENRRHATRLLSFVESFTSPLAASTSNLLYSCCWNLELYQNVCYSSSFNASYATSDGHSCKFIAFEYASRRHVANPLL